MSKYLIISPNGYGNIGDDMCALGGKYAVEQVDPEAEVVISQPPMKTNLIAWADYVILSGGGILYDRAPKNMENYLQYIDVAVAEGKKAAVLGVGVQGIVTDEGRTRYKESLNKCEFVSVRTELDKQMLEEIGVENVHATFDIAFLTPGLIPSMHPKPGLLKNYGRRTLLQHVKNSDKPKVGICMINLRMLKGKSYEGVFSRFDDAVEKFVREMHDDFDIYMIQHAKEDGNLMRELAKQYKLTFVPYRGFDDLPTTYELYNHLDMLLGVRLHSIALGLMTATPTIAVGSATAKQKRLYDYALPSVQNQFYEFGDIERLEAMLTDMAKTKHIDVKLPSNDDMKRIETLSSRNLELLKSMIS